MEVEVVVGGVGGPHHFDDSGLEKCVSGQARVCVCVYKRASACDICNWLLPEPLPCSKHGL